MLSYQHAYHAGCRADLHKHAALSLLLSQLTQKDKPLSYMETHAGRGLYDLSSVEASKTQEAQWGIMALESRFPAGHPYPLLLEQIRQRYGRTAYPGSPLLAKTLLRATDELHLMELHPQEHKALKASLKSPNTHIHFRDGYEGVLALSPPKIRRGLVLVDPSYEVKAEYAQAADFALKLKEKWPEATIVIWYPLLDAGNHTALLEPLEGWWHQQLQWEPPKPKAMRGSGLLMHNVPYGSEEALEKLCEFVGEKTRM